MAKKPPIFFHSCSRVCSIASIRHFTSAVISRTHNANRNGIWTMRKLNKNPTACTPTFVRTSFRKSSVSAIINELACRLVCVESICKIDFARAHPIRAGAGHSKKCHRIFPVCDIFQSSFSELKSLRCVWKKTGTTTQGVEPHQSTNEQHRIKHTNRNGIKQK